MQELLLKLQDIWNSKWAEQFLYGLPWTRTALHLSGDGKVFSSVEIVLKMEDCNNLDADRTKDVVGDVKKVV